MTDTFGATTETLTKMIPVAVAGNALRRVSRATAPKRRRVIKSTPKPRPVAKKRKATPKRKAAKRGRRR